MKYEYNMVVFPQEIAMLSSEGFPEQARDLSSLLTEFGSHLQEWMDDLGHDDWEPVSHSVSAIGDVLMTTVLVRRQSS